MWAGATNNRYRTVVLSQQAAAFIDSHHGVSRFTEVWESGGGIEWILARKPEIGVARPSDEGEEEYYLYSVAADPLADTRAFLVLYSFGEDRVDVHAITFTDTLPDAD